VRGRAHVRARDRRPAPSVVLVRAAGMRDAPRMKGAGARARVLVALAAVAMLVVLGAWLLRGTGPCDDDFIVYRYARNLVRGNGLVLQPGHAVAGHSA